jgi:hypothetical protein
MAIEDEEKGMRDNSALVDTLDVGCSVIDGRDPGIRYRRLYVKAKERYRERSPVSCLLRETVFVANREQGTKQLIALRDLWCCAYPHSHGSPSSSSGNFLNAAYD